ncbi:uncharacterized protein LOC115711020 [Cannabis sativa]|uniref:uncharacterized protein LOC115711020 n=1 Tax=Cannabis sativa TaxID=3483 RepID=UPI0029CA5E75|nr:uncharacterized protein LOC115711020 [Cannabis sativa]
MKPWDPNENYKKEDVQKVPVWVQLEELELKYWGQKSLFKIVAQVGNPIMVDSVTRERERLNYPRILVEVQMDQNLPDLLEFENEFGTNTSVGIKYEWKPISCTHCSGVGHAAAECKKNSNGKQKWIVKSYKRQQPQVDEEGFTKVQSKKNSVSRESTGTKDAGAGVTINTKVGNMFQVLEEEELVTDANVHQQADVLCKTGGGEIPLSLMDKLLAWNVRRANSQHKQQMIKQFINSQKVDFVGLLEIRVKASKLGALYLNVFVNWCFSSNIAWHAGGKIVIAWNPDRFTVDILKCTSQLMHLRLTTTEGFNSLLTVVYASNNRTERRVLWKDLCELKSNDNWLLMGDFNDILAKEERIGHRVKTHPDTEFLQCVNT